MRLVNLLSGPPEIGPCVLGVGTFDGVHLGHRALLAEVIGQAREHRLPAVVFCFDHPPRRVLHPEEFPGELTTPEEKFSLLMATGVDWVVFRPFDHAFARTSPADFIHRIILAQLQARLVCVGFNFQFGHDRRGTSESLCQELAGAGCACLVIPSVIIGGEPVSSSRIRQAIATGQLETATQLLGREASFTGTVIHGDHRGREMGFPTANLDLEGSSKVLPPRGVYLCLVDTAQGTHHALVNIGIRPTFGRERMTLEAHLLDFHGDLYHQPIRVRFQKRLRAEVRFPSSQALVAQIQEDLALARHMIGSARERTA
ncbi:MAG: bifunctional riboflavin kinase/FAD synthetase [Candidatus Ozemobacter sibiricus]|uniref:Riboflavin biosynthesis protein n=1 Tax=Candidatus Ozemobacter sibiricus TaxID=2268124 RepID=A0A367ZU81_9BACT|nr:MAG: bifunctional riboflavin kinase/FAD synthetase [Candidatus Ozemobacter sibiricus]